MGEIKLELITGAYSYNSPTNLRDHAWVYNNNELYAAREGTGNKYYYCTRLEFTTNNTVFLNAKRITLSLTSSRGYTSRYTTAILCSDALSGYEVYKLTSEENIKSLPGFMSMTEGEPSEEKMIYTFDDFEDSKIQLESNRTYFIYIKRLVGLENKNGGVNGFMAIVNPFYNNKKDQASLILEYEQEVTWPSASELNLEPKKIIRNPKQSFLQDFILSRKDGEELGELPNLTWEANAIGQAVDISTWFTNDNGLFTFNTNTQPGVKVKIIASWGSGAAKQFLESIIIFPPRWSGFKSWLVGYAMKIAGTQVPYFIQTPISYQYKDLVLPVFPKYDINQYPYVCLVEDAITIDTYKVYISSKEFVYNEKNGEICPQIDSLVMVSSLYKNRGIWTPFSKSNSLEKIAFIPLWSNSDIKDLAGNIEIEAYDPQPIYK